MPSDEEINQLVARKLRVQPRDVDLDAWPPDYCHSIAAAWEIVEHLKKKETPFFVRVAGLMDRPCACGQFDRYHYLCNIFSAAEMSPKTFCATTAPMSICKAFLAIE